MIYDPLYSPTNKWLKWLKMVSMQMPLGITTVVDKKQTVHFCHTKSNHWRCEIR